MFEKRVLKIKGGSNFRDLGGYQTSDGKKILWGRLFRGSALNNFTNHDLRVLKRHHIDTIIDFRSLDESLNDPDIYPKTVNDLRLTVLDQDTTYSTITPAEFHRLSHSAGFAYQQMMRTYRRLITDEFSQRAYRQFFDYLLNQGNGAILFHCTKGKDRTGIATALFLLAVGIDKDTIFQDYFLTDTYNHEQTEFELDRMMKNGDDDTDIDNVKHFLLTDRRYLENAFAAMDEIAGSSRAYLEKYLGLDDQKIQVLRNKYLS
ncbi:tyrosine-protein phosphatase [Oenococcus sp. UCMA 17063]|nr:tyrosine-protein phosphatase [Oenococcus sp. UCMA 17063]